jgi:hypothetical protein
MTKYFFLFLFVFSLPCIERAYSQTGSDSIEKTVMIDSLETETSDSAEAENRSVNLLIPMEDSGYLPKGPVRKVSLRQVNSFLQNPDYAYANDPAYREKEPQSRPGFFSRLFNSPLIGWVILLVVLGLIALGLFGIYQLAKENSFNWFTRSVKKINSGTGELLTDKGLDYDEAIRKFQEKGNYRMAIRYMYLRLIHIVREKGEIQFRDSSTNAEIVRAFGNHPKTDEFRWLATAYEYIYYGDFLPKQELFDKIKNKFDDLQLTFTI